MRIYKQSHNSKTFHRKTLALCTTDLYNLLGLGTGFRTVDKDYDFSENGGIISQKIIHKS